MRYIIPSLVVALLVFMVGFRPKNAQHNVKDIPASLTASAAITPSEVHSENAVEIVEQQSSVSDDQTAPIGDAQATSFVDYAKTLIGTPYVFGSVDPARGLDCSGFVNCVSNHFGIKVPRSSVDFTNVGTTVETNDAKPGDLILFTGTDASKRVVGHIGIITSNEAGEIEFIHSSSGQAKGVIISEMSDHYKTRFMKVIRIFPIATDKVVA